MSYFHLLGNSCYLSSYRLFRSGCGHNVVFSSYRCHYHQVWILRILFSLVSKLQEIRNQKKKKNKNEWHSEKQKIPFSIMDVGNCTPLQNRYHRVLNACIFKKRHRMCPWEKSPSPEILLCQKEADFLCK